MSFFLITPSDKLTLEQLTREAQVAWTPACCLRRRRRVASARKCARRWRPFPKFVQPTDQRRPLIVTAESNAIRHGNRNSETSETSETSENGAFR